MGPGAERGPVKMTSWIFIGIDQLGCRFDLSTVLGPGGRILIGEDLVDFHRNSSIRMYSRLSNDFRTWCPKTPRR